MEDVKYPKVSYKSVLLPSLFILLATHWVTGQRGLRRQGITNEEDHTGQDGDDHDSLENPLHPRENRKSADVRRA